MVLFITPSFSKGGAEKNILNIINSLSGAYEVCLIICNTESKYVELLNKNNNTEVIVLGKPNVRRSIPDIVKIIKNKKPNVVYTSALHLALPLILIKRFFLFDFKNIVRVPTLPSNKLEKNTTANLILKIFRNRLLNLADIVIAQTAQMKDEVEKFYKVDSEKVYVIKNMVDEDQIRRKAEELVTLEKKSFYFCAAGTLYSAKGFDFLIKAFSTHLFAFPNSKLLILGEEGVEKGYRSYLEKIIMELEVQNSVLMLGHQENPYKYFRFSDAFVLSSLKEGFPNVVLENLVLKKPVLATDCVDFTGIINENNGIIIKRGDLNEMVDGLKNIRNIEPSSPASYSNFNYNDWFKSIMA